MTQEETDEMQTKLNVVTAERDRLLALTIENNRLQRGLPGVGEFVEVNQAHDLTATPNWKRDEVAEGFGRGVPELCGFVTKNRWNCHWSEEGERWRRISTTNNSQEEQSTVNLLHRELEGLKSKMKAYAEAHRQWSVVCGYLCQRDDVVITRGFENEAVRLMEEQAQFRKLLMDFAGDFTRLNPLLFWNGGCALKGALDFIREVLATGKVPTTLGKT